MVDGKDEGVKLRVSAMYRAAESHAFGKKDMGLVHQYNRRSSFGGRCVERFPDEGAVDIQIPGIRAVVRVEKDYPMFP